MDANNNTQEQDSEDRTEKKAGHSTGKRKRRSTNGVTTRAKKHNTTGTCAATLFQDSTENQSEPQIRDNKMSGTPKLVDVSNLKALLKESNEEMEIYWKRMWIGE